MGGGDAPVARVAGGLEPPVLVGAVRGGGAADTAGSPADGSGTASFNDGMGAIADEAAGGVGCASFSEEGGEPIADGLDCTSFCERSFRERAMAAADPASATTVAVIRTTLRREVAARRM